MSSLSPRAPSPPTVGNGDGVEHKLISLNRLTLQLDPGAQDDPLALTSLRAHYLKKELLQRAVGLEIAALARPDAFALLGPPFRPPADAATVERETDTDLPILRYLFKELVLTFPLLRAAPPHFFADTVQVFADDLLSKHLSSSDDREENTKRRRLALRLQRYFVLLLSSAFATNPVEQVVRLSSQDSQRLAETEARAAAAAQGQLAQGHWDVNIVAVRVTSHRSAALVRKTSELFLVRTTQGNLQPTIVARKYADFVKLADELRKQFTQHLVPRPPARDRSNVQYQAEDVVRSAETASPRRSTDSVESEPVTLSREKNRLTLRAYLRTLLASPDVTESPSMQKFLFEDPTQLTAQEERDATAREALDQARQSESARFAAETTERVAALQSHLMDFKADLVQPDGLARVFATIKQVSHIADLPASYQAMIAWARISAASTLFHLFRRGDTSSELLAQVKRIHSMMPYRILKGILKISNPMTMIRTGLDLFLAQPFGQKSLVQRMFLQGISEELKELHAVESVVEQKIDESDLVSRVKAYVALEPEPQDEVRQLSHAPGQDLLSAILLSPQCGGPMSEEQYKRCGNSAAAYARYSKHKTRLAHSVRQSLDQGVPPDASLFDDLHTLLHTLIRARDKQQMLALLSEGVTVSLLKQVVTIFYAPLAQVYKAANISDQLGDLQAFVSDLIATVEGLDNPTSQPSPACSSKGSPQVSPRVSMSTLREDDNPASTTLATNTSTGNAAPAGAQHTVQVFIDLVGRHEQAAYSFVHSVHSRGGGVFDGLMDWIQRFINLVRGPTLVAADQPQDSAHASAPNTQGGGLGTLDMEILLPAGSTERAALLAEVDQLVVHAYQCKLVREAKVRRKLVRQRLAQAAEHLDQRVDREGQPDAALDHWDTADDAAFSAAVLKHLGFGDAMRDEVVDATLDQVNDSEDDDDDYDESDAGSYASVHSGGTSVDSTGPIGTSLDVWGNPMRTPRLAEMERTKSSDPVPPEVNLIPELLPMFLEVIRPLLQRHESPSPPPSTTPLPESSSWGGSIFGLGSAVGSTLSGWARLGGGWSGDSTPDGRPPNTPQSPPQL